MDDDVLYPVRLFGLPLLLGAGVVATIYDQWAFRWLALFLCGPSVHDCRSDLASVCRPSALPRRL